jgi:hypothetical protein
MRDEVRGEERGRVPVQPPRGTAGMRGHEPRARRG